ncbi:GIY-YIG catalytic domain protein [Phycisphaerae bacterium RAS1]|nr:GIY-YIG catalytic domain protein [Phycisphaerae bacterium RAS1]
MSRAKLTAGKKAWLTRLKRSGALVVQHLEGISRTTLEECQKVIRDYVRGRNGVYALYSGRKLYYVGLASNLRTRLKGHLSNRHGESWDRFSVYLTDGESHLRELESLVLRIVRPPGNTQIGHFAQSENLAKKLGRDLRRQWAQRYRELMGELEEEPSSAPRGQTPKNSRRIRVGQVRFDRNRAALAKYVRLPAALRGEFKGRIYEARARRDGRLRCCGSLHETLSGAALAICKRPVNGWSFWTVKNSRGEYVRLTTLMHSRRRLD